MFHDSVDGVITRDDGGRDEDRGDRKLGPERTDGCKQDLAEAERQPGRDRADEDCAQPACASVIGPAASGDTCEERQREDGERKQQPAEEADGCDGLDDFLIDYCGL